MLSMRLMTSFNIAAGCIRDIPGGTVGRRVSEWEHVCFRGRYEFNVTPQTVWCLYFCTCVLCPSIFGRLTSESTFESEWKHQYVHGQFRNISGTQASHLDPQILELKLPGKENKHVKDREHCSHKTFLGPNFTLQSSFLNFLKSHPQWWIGC